MGIEKVYNGDGVSLETVKASIEVGDLKPPTKTLAMNSQKITGLATPSATGDALRKGSVLTTTELPALIEDKAWRGDASNRPVVTTSTGYWG